MNSRHSRGSSAPEHTPAPAKGRPRLPDNDRMVQRTIRLTPAAWRKLDEAGGISALRALVERWRPAASSRRTDTPSTF